MTDLTKKEFKTLISRLKANAKRRNIEFHLKSTDIDKIGIPITCPVLGIPIYFNNGKVQDDSISFDRIDSTKGYTVDNVIVVSHRVNKLKSNASLREMRSMVEFYDSLN
jgi:hypothetical protein